MENKMPTAARGREYLEASPVRATNCLMAKARLFLEDESAVNFKETPLGSASYACRAFDGEVGSWFNSSDARGKTLKWAAYITFAQLALM